LTATPARPAPAAATGTCGCPTGTRVRTDTRTSDGRACASGTRRPGMYAIAPGGHAATSGTRLHTAARRTGAISSRTCTPGVGGRPAGSCTCASTRTSDSRDSTLGTCGHPTGTRIRTGTARPTATPARSAAARPPAGPASTPARPAATRDTRHPPPHVLQQDRHNQRPHPHARHPGSPGRLRACASTHTSRQPGQHAHRPNRQPHHRAWHLRLLGRDSHPYRHAHIPRPCPYARHWHAPGRTSTDGCEVTAPGTRGRTSGESRPLRQPHHHARHPRPRGWPWDRCGQRPRPCARHSRLAGQRPSIRQRFQARQGPSANAGPGPATKPGQGHGGSRRHRGSRRAPHAGRSALGGERWRCHRCLRARAGGEGVLDRWCWQSSPCGPGEGLESVRRRGP
jgi:hypothetical protein